MKKLLLLLLGTILISAISYFCFLDKIDNIKHKIVSKVEESYHSKGMDWVKVRLSGEGIYSTRNILLEGVAPSKEQKAEAAKIALRDNSVYSVVNNIEVGTSVAKEKIEESPIPKQGDAEVDKEVVANVAKPKEEKIENKIQEVEKKLKKETMAKKEEPKEEKIAETKTPLEDSELLVSKDKNNNIILSGKVANSELYNEILFQAKKLFGEKRVKDELIVENNLKPLDYHAISIALDELQTLDYGEFHFKDKNLTLSGYVNNFDNKEKILSELDSFMPENIRGSYRLDSPKKVPNKSDEILEVAQKKAEEKLKKIEFETKPEIEKKPIIKKVELSCQDRFTKLLSSQKIHFKYNRYEIDKSSYKLLDDLSKIAKECSDKAIEIAGHTDSDGSQKYNQILSQNRAQEVKKYLVKHGVDEKMLVATGYGELKPIADNNTPASKAKNRRIEFTIITPSELEELKSSKKVAKKQLQTEVKKQKVAKQAPLKKQIKIRDLSYCIEQFDNLLSSNKIYFSLNKRAISKKSRPLLKKLSQIAQSCPDMELTIDAYTDSIGSAKKNLAISQTKADTVRRYMIKMGVAADKIKAVGHGEADPIADNTTVSGRSQNRRVEFNIKGRK